MKQTILILTCALILHAFSTTTYADIVATRITESIPAVTNNSHPAIHGMTLVWQAKGGLANTTSATDDWEIFAYDLASGTVTQLTDDAYDDILPKTDGLNIVWQKHASIDGSQIFLYQLGGNILPGGTRISQADNEDHFSPNIADGIVIWSRQHVTQSYSPREVLLYNAKTHTGPTVISNPEYNCGAPRIAANLILFQQEDAEGIETLLLYNVADKNPEPKPIPENFTWHANAQVDGTLTVLSRYSGNDREIFLHSQKKGYIQITDNDLSDLTPTINHNFIAWVADKDIYTADISSIITPILIPKPGRDHGVPLPFVYKLLLLK